MLRAVSLERAIPPAQKIMEHKREMKVWSASVAMYYGTLGLLIAIPPALCRVGKESQGPPSPITEIVMSKGETPDFSHSP